MRIISTFLFLVVFAGFSAAQNSKFDVFFLKNEITINENVKLVLNNVVNSLKSNKQLVVDVKSTENSELGKNRVTNVSNYLVANGIDLYRIMSKITVTPDQDNVIQLNINETTSEIIASNQNSKSNSTEKNSSNSKSDVVVNAGDVVISNMFFGFDKDNTVEYYANLDKLVSYLKNNSDAKIEIRGYSDLQGEASYNLDLSYRRADFAKKYLVEKGCNNDLIIVKTYGEKEQISSNESPESRKYNRRVEFFVLNQGKNKLIVEKIEVPEKYKL